MKPIFITATGTGVGKTHAACLLIDALFALGVRVAPFKPIETGVDLLLNVLPNALSTDAARLYEAARSHGLNLSIDTICPVRFELTAAPAVARGENAIDWRAIDRGFEECARSADIVLIEGAGGAFAPIDDEFFSIDLAARFNAKILVIAGDQLGTIHNLLTTIEAIRNRVNIGLLNESPFWAISIKDSLDFERITQPYLSKKFGSFWRIPKDIDTIAKALCR